MAKVRVYDLAREFGMKGKELADRLVELGYAVTSHSSTLEDDMIIKSVISEKSMDNFVSMFSAEVSLTITVKLP